MHHSACMHQKHLLRFIKSKLKKEPDEVVIFRDGKWLTLREVFESLNLTGCALYPLPAVLLKTWCMVSHMPVVRGSLCLVYSLQQQKPFLALTVCGSPWQCLFACTVCSMLSRS